MSRSTARRPTHRPSAVVRTAGGLALVLALVLAACGASGSSSVSSAGTAPSASAAAGTPTAALSTPSEPTEVPGGESLTPAPLPSDVTTTATDWGTILDAVPSTFPVYPGAEPAEWPDGPVSGAWIVDAGVDKVATWYRDALEALGYATAGLSDPLEDGTRVLDSTADIPECRIQTAFHPAAESTMITVLYAAGCAGGEG